MEQCHSTQPLTATGVIQQVSGECSPAFVNGYFVAGQAIDNTGKYVQLHRTLLRLEPHTLTTNNGYNNYSFSVANASNARMEIWSPTCTGTPITAHNGHFSGVFWHLQLHFDIDT